RQFDGSDGRDDQEKTSSRKARSRFAGRKLKRQQSIRHRKRVPRYGSLVRLCRHDKQREWHAVAATTSHRRDEFPPVMIAVFPPGTLLPVFTPFWCAQNVTPATGR